MRASKCTYIDPNYKTFHVVFSPSGDITKEYLLNNNTELTALLESVNAIVKMGAGELSGAVDMTKVCVILIVI